MEKEIKKGFWSYFVIFLVLIVLGALISFFINEVYKIGLALSVIFSIISLVMFYLFWRKGFFNFLLVACVSIYSFISLDISFNLSFYSIFILSLIIGIVFGLLSLKYNSRKDYAWLLLVAFVIIWVILAFNVTYRDDWLLENYLTIPFVLLLLVISKWFKLSKTSYSLIFIYTTLHIIGSHYTYGEVPFGYWLQNFFDLSRNHYDRIVHFSFGFLLAYPVREIFIRIGKQKGIWALYSPIMLVLGLSCVYELIEWGVAIKYGGDLGIAYLGSQGDIWDAQQDMFVAGLGSILAMTITAITVFAFKGKEYWKEIKESFKVEEPEQGEVALQRFSRKK